MAAFSLGRTQWALVPACFPFLICLVFTIAYWTERYEPVEATVLALMLLPVLTIAFIPRICWRDRNLTLVLAATVLLLGWMAACGVTPLTAVTVTSLNDSGPGSLRAALAEACPPPRCQSPRGRAPLSAAR